MTFDAATIKEMINSIIEFFQIVIAEVQKALKGIVKVNGYEDPSNFPENFQPTTEAE